MRTGVSAEDILPAEPLEGVDVVVPVLNEREMLPRFLDRVDSLGLPLHLIFVDNGSVDGTLECLTTRPEITVIAHGRNLGYGRSLADGLSASKADRVIIIDADGEYPPEAIPLLLGLDGLDIYRRMPFIRVWSIPSLGGRGTFTLRSG